MTSDLILSVVTKACLIEISYFLLMQQNERDDVLDKDQNMAFCTRITMLLIC